METLEIQEESPASAGQPGAPGSVSAITDGLATELATKHGAQLEPVKGDTPTTEPGRKAGRPPIHGLYSRAAGSDGKHPVLPPGPAPMENAQVEIPGPPPPERVTIPPEIVSEVVGDSINLAEAFAQNKIHAVAKLAGLTDGEIIPQLRRAELGSARKATVAKIVPLAAKEWGLDLEMSPTLALGLLLGPWLVSSGDAYLTLAKLATERQALNKSTGKNPTNQEAK